MNNNKKPSKHNKFSNNSNQNNDVKSNIDLDADNYTIDNLDQKLLGLLVRGYENKQVATQVKTPLSTIQRRIRNLFENQYVSRKNELNYRKLGFRKGYLQITLRGDRSFEVAQKLAVTNGIIAVSELMGNFDILCTCIFKNTDELFSLIENIKTIERIDKVAWSEEVRAFEIEEKIAPFGVRTLQEFDSYDRMLIIQFRILPYYSNMPKPGYKSITVSEHVYKKFFKAYEKSKKTLEVKGIRSFSGYLTSMMEEMMLRYEAFAKHAPYMEKLSIDQNRVVLQDNKRNRIAEVLLKEGELQCLLDEKSDCVHVGFVYSLPELYNNEKVKAPPPAAYTDG